VPPRSVHGDELGGEHVHGRVVELDRHPRAGNHLHERVRVAPQQGKIEDLLALNVLAERRRAALEHRGL
jgi:hypothetical protein